jgi:dynactin complex subunit
MGTNPLQGSSLRPASLIPVDNMALLCREMAVVRYIGHTDFAPGIWIGLELKNPKGNEPFY